MPKEDSIDVTYRPSEKKLRSNWTAREEGSQYIPPNPTSECEYTSTWITEESIVAWGHVQLWGGLNSGTSMRK